MIKSGMASPYLYGVDALRFICALMVTVFHLGFASWASPGLLRNYRMSEIENFAQPGWVGVELFFIISGLVIVNSAASADAGSFVRGRVLRLYPAMWICASVVLVFIAMKDGVHPGIFVKYLSSMMLFPFGPWLDGQFWTLGCEIGFLRAGLRDDRDKVEVADAISGARPRRSQFDLYRAALCVSGIGNPRSIQILWSARYSVLLRNILCHRHLCLGMEQGAHDPHRLARLALRDGRCGGTDSYGGRES